MKSSREKKTGTKKWRTVLITLCIIVVIFLTVSYGLRSSMYLKARLTPKLAELGAMIGGGFRFENVRAMGFTGIILDDVVFEPATPGANPIYFKSITVYPALLGMFIGDLNASLVELHGARASFLLDKDKGDRHWIETLRASVTGGNVALDSEIGVTGPARVIPDLTCRDCYFSFSHKGRTVELTVPEERVEIVSRESGTVAFGYELVDICTMTAIDDKTCFKARAAGLTVKDTFSIPQIEFLGVSRSGISIQSILLKNLELAHNDARNAIFVDNGQIEAQIGQKSSLAAFSGRYMLEFAQVEVLYENDPNRIGIGLSLRSLDTAIARIFGGYDFNEKKLALTFDTTKFNFARFFQKSDFIKYLKIDALPLSGHISLIYDEKADHAWLETDAAVIDGKITSPILARDPLTGINGNFTANAWFDFGTGTFGIDDAHGAVGSLPFKLSMHRLLDEEKNHHFDINFSSKGDSADFIRSLPVGFAPMLTGYKLEGGYAADLKLSFNDADIDNLLLDINIDLNDVKTVEFDPRSNFELLKGDAFMVRINAATVPLEIGPRDEKWVGFYDLPRDTAYAFVASEDGKFFSHPGFDIRAIRASLIADIKAKKFVRGGSTISQQVVKNIFLNHDKTASRKFQEAFLTWQMEKTLTKLKIFELYLNLAHFAKDTYGIRAAAEYYFQKSISQLTLRESLFLASILPNPIIFGRQYVEGKLSSSRLTKMINVGNALKATRRISAEEWDKSIPLIRDGKISDRPKPEIMR